MSDQKLLFSLPQPRHDKVTCDSPNHDLDAQTHLTLTGQRHAITLGIGEAIIVSAESTIAKVVVRRGVPKEKSHPYYSVISTLQSWKSEFEIVRSQTTWAQKVLKGSDDLDFDEQDIVETHLTSDVLNSFATH